MYQLRKIQIRDLQFGEQTKIEESTLYINKKDMVNLLIEDERIASITLHIARPGESVRIIPVKDVIEPRAKLKGEAFPGVDGAIEEVGTGITYALKGCAVVTTGEIVGFQEGIIDMKGPLVDYTPFSKLNNLVIQIEKKSHVLQHEHEETVRRAGIKAAHFMGKIGLTCEQYEEETFDWKSLSEKSTEYESLPKVLYIYLCMSQGLMHDTYFYGKDSKKIMPTLVSPFEVMDGAIVSGNCVSPGSKTTTYHHLNNAVINECLRRHGKEINFMGIILNPLMTTLDDKYRNCVQTAKLASLIGVEGAIISQEGFGNPTTDLMQICKKLEQKGIKAVLISNEDAGTDGKSESLPDGVAEANAIISTGNSNARIELPPMDHIIGDLKAIERVTGGFVGSIHQDGGLTIEIHGIMGSHNLQGFGNLSAITV